MSLIDLLDDGATWTAFTRYKLDGGHLIKRDEQCLEALVTSASYTDVAHLIRRGDMLPPPQKTLLNKFGTAKKRVVYSFDGDVMWVLKLLAWLLYRFDDKQPEGCYSFRRNYGAHRAFKDIIRTPKIGEHWCCKLDISNYFNSIPIPRLLPIIVDELGEDRPLCEFLERLLTADTALYGDTLLNEKRGVMAGTPTAPFLANLYLRELDNCFVGRGLPYARYSDDVIIFARTEREILECQDEAVRIIREHGLGINEEKAYIAAPGASWEFLGMSYHDGTIDLSAATCRKLKGKVRRKARALRRWMLRYEALPQRAERAFIRSFNRKFFDRCASNDLTWSRWFFPVLTTDKSLREIDHYLQQYIRYISTGRFNAGNYRLDYRSMKALGYRSLVHEYHADRSLYRNRRESEDTTLPQ